MFLDGWLWGQGTQMKYQPSGEQGSSWHGWLRGPGYLKSGVCPLASGPRFYIHWMRGSRFLGGAVCLLVGGAMVQGILGKCWPTSEQSQVLKSLSIVPQASWSWSGAVLVMCEAGSLVCCLRCPRHPTAGASPLVAMLGLDMCRLWVCVAPKTGVLEQDWCPLATN